MYNGMEWKETEYRILLTAILILPLLRLLLLLLLRGFSEYGMERALHGKDSLEIILSIKVRFTVHM